MHNIMLDSKHISTVPLKSNRLRRILSDIPRNVPCRLQRLPQVLSGRFVTASYHLPFSPIINLNTSSLVSGEQRILQATFSSNKKHMES